MANNSNNVPSITNSDRELTVFASQISDDFVEQDDRKLSKDEIDKRDKLIKSFIEGTDEHLSKFDELKYFTILQKDIFHASLSFINAGVALFFIQEKKLYKDKFGTMSNFIDKKTNMSRSSAYNLIENAKIALELKKEYLKSENDLVFPTKEAHLRCLRGLDGNQMMSVWEKSIENIILSNSSDTQTSDVSTESITKRTAVRMMKASYIKEAIKDLELNDQYLANHKIINEEIKEKSKKTTKPEDGAVSLTEDQSKTINSIRLILTDVVKKSDNIDDDDAVGDIEKVFRKVCNLLGNNSLNNDDDISNATSKIARSIVHNAKLENAKVRPSDIGEKG